MDYNGEIATIPLGRAGLYTDSPHPLIPQQYLIRANNAICFNDALEKDFGSLQWNTSALPSGVKQFWDFWPNENLQRVVCVLQDGTVYRMPDMNTQQLVTASDSTQTNLNSNNFVTLVQGGAEQQGNNKKLFIFTGNNPVQVISGDNKTRSNIRAGASDWSSNAYQPIAGIIHRNRLWAFGNTNNPHGVYASLATDHEDFTSQPFIFQVFPGEGEKIIAAGIFRGVLYFFKLPYGVYYLVDTDPSSANWYIARFTADFGAASPHCISSFLDEMIVANSLGGVTSMKTLLLFNDLSTSDIFHQGRVKKFADNEIRKDGINNRQVMYYADQKRIHISFQSNAGYRNDRICYLDYKNVSQLSVAAQYSVALPKFTWSNKDQPSCLGLVKDIQKVPRPFYGADDGYLYQMDKQNRWVGDWQGTTTKTAYTFDCETPHSDLGWLDPKLAPLNKNFDFLEVEYEPSGGWDLSVDVFIDGKFHRTMAFTQDSGTNELDSFVLNFGRADGGVPHSKRLPLQGTGRRIGFRLYESGAQNVRLVNLRLYFTAAGYQSRK